MAEKQKELVIDELNIFNYTVEESETVMTYARKNKDGYPVVWPTKNLHGKRIVLSFINAEIYDLEGKKVSDLEGNFDVIDDEEFDKNDKEALEKVEFISSLLSSKRIVKGGVYFKGEYYAGKITGKQCNALTKSFMKNYFHIEDRDLILSWFDKMGQTDLLQYWPTKSYDKNATEVIFSAVNATISKRDGTKSDQAPINFDIRWGDTFDLNNSDDVCKTDVIHSLLDSDRVVRGFYYKGELIEEHLSTKRKLYFEKSFVKKNFTVDQRDYLFTAVSKDSKTGYPLFWPMKNKDGREIVISVVNAVASWLDHKYSNFDVYTDELFDLNKEEFVTKLKVIQKLLSNDSVITGGLYLDGMLVPGLMNKQEVTRRKAKVEKALKIYLDDNEDFMRISLNFTVDDSDKLLRVVSKYDRYFPDNKILVRAKDLSYKEEDGIVLKGINVNPVGEYGDYLFDEPLNFMLKNEEKDITPEMFELFKYIANPTAKVRGALYFNGINIAYKDNASRKTFVDTYLKSVLSEEQYAELKKFAEEVKFYQFHEDKKSRMPLYWATKDRNGRETLLSVVDADVHFKNGRQIIRASNDMNFNIYIGETFGLVGESGSGKTTISRAILGINKLAKGGIYFKGKLISSGLSRREAKAVKKNIQMIFQDPAASLNERANVDYIVSEGLYNFHMFKTNEERLEKVSAMMRNVGLLPEHLSRYPHEFSGGQRQRIGIARALVIEPQLVLADEPISALDVSIRAQVLNLLKKLQKEQQLTYLFIAHDLSIIKYISDRIAVMHQGYIVELGPADEIYSHPLHPYTKSLLTAIPQPDPRTKNERIRVPYSKGALKYEECVWEEAEPGHFVLVGDLNRDVIYSSVRKSEEKTAPVSEPVQEEKAPEAEPIKEETTETVVPEKETPVKEENHEETIPSEEKLPEEKVIINDIAADTPAEKKTPKKPGPKKKAPLKKATKENK